MVMLASSASPNFWRSIRSHSSAVKKKPTHSTEEQYCSEEWCGDGSKARIDQTGKSKAYEDKCSPGSAHGPVTFQINDKNRSNLVMTFSEKEAAQEHCNDKLEEISLSKDGPALPRQK